MIIISVRIQLVLGLSANKTLYIRSIYFKRANCEDRNLHIDVIIVFACHGSKILQWNFAFSYKLQTNL